MKKLVPFLLTVTMAVMVMGCGSSKKEQADNAADSANTANADLAEEKMAEGDIGETMCTSWFDFTVNSAYLCDAFADYKASQGNELLVINVTVENTFKEEIPMFDDDFWVQWGSETSDAAYAYPITEPISSDQGVLPESYRLDVGDSKTGVLVYEVPAEQPRFAIAYLEVTSEEEPGNAYVVYFEPAKQ